MPLQPPFTVSPGHFTPPSPPLQLGEEMHIGHLADRCRPDTHRPVLNRLELIQNDEKVKSTNFFLSILSF